MMHRLLHDLRTPLGVAQGYLRLIRDGSLKTDADRDRALDQAASALGQVTRMFQEVAGYLDEEANAGRTPASAAAFAGRVEAVAREHGFDVVQDGVETDAVMDLPFGLSASAGAVVRVFESAMRRRPTGTSTLLRVSASDAELQFVASAEAAQGQTPPEGRPENPAEIKEMKETKKMRPFDPWREPGLDVALACERIARASGEIRSDQASADGLAIAFPVRRIQV